MRAIITLEAVGAAQEAQEQKLLEEGEVPHYDRTARLPPSSIPSLLTLSVCPIILWPSLLTVRATEAAAKAIRDGQPSVDPVTDPNGTPGEPAPTGRPPALSNHLVEWQDHLRREFGTRVEIRLSGAQSGQIVIPFSDADEFQRVWRAMERRAA